MISKIHTGFTLPMMYEFNYFNFVKGFVQRENKFDDRDVIKKLGN